MATPSPNPGALPKALAGLLLAAGLLACDKGSGPSNPSGNEGYLTVDSSLVIDRYPFLSAACAEVLPAGYVNADSIPKDAVARVYVVSTACYAVSIRIEDSLGRAVRSLEYHFNLPGRIDGDKDRGAEGFLPWDGRNDAGGKAGPGAYLWRMDFNFGMDRRVRFRADIRLE